MSTSQPTVYLPTILLDETNHPSWFFRVESFLKGQKLYGFVDGTVPCPPKCILDSSGNSVPNPEFEVWCTQDQSIVNMIGQTLSSAATSCAVGSKTAFDLWRNLRNKFAAPSRQNILQLKTNLQSLRKGNDSIETYLDKVKVARDALETVGVFLDDEDVIVTVLRGLPSEYNAIKGVIRAQAVTSTLSDLKTLLKATEIDLETDSQLIMAYCFQNTFLTISLLFNFKFICQLLVMLIGLVILMIGNLPLSLLFCLMVLLFHGVVRNRMQCPDLLQRLNIEAWLTLHQRFNG